LEKQTTAASIDRARGRRRDHLMIGVHSILPPLELRGDASMKVRRVNDRILEEHPAPEDRSRRLVWRQSFHGITLELADLRATTVLNEYELDYIEAAGADDPWTAVKRAKGAKGIVTAFSRLGDDRDSYNVLGPPDEQGVIETQHAKTSLSVRILPSSEAAANGDPLAGNAGRLWISEDDDPSELTLRLGEAELASVFRYVEDVADVHLRIRLLHLAYTHEMEDALREWWHPRSFLVDRASSVVVEAIELSRSKERPIAATKRDDFDLLDEPDATADEPPAAISGTHQALTGQDFSKLLSTMASIKVALWVAIGMAFIALVT
jgi:hypothetical protein